MLLPLRLLLVDDEERFLATTKALLEKKGVNTSTAPSAHDAMKVLSSTQIDVVILDVKMPGGDGLEVLRWIKQNHPLVEVIMLTGHATFESAIEGMKLGAFDYLMKPSDIEVLLDKANEAHAKKQAREKKIQKARIERIISNPLAALDDTLPEEE